MTERLAIVGASSRAAAFSALRAGLAPWCADLFADADLAAVAPVVACAADRYPDDLARLLVEAPPGPWMYVGGLENRPRLVERLATIRPLWGNGPAALAAARSPFRVVEILRAAGLPLASVCQPSEVPAQGRWLLKPLTGAGGVGIHFAAEPVVSETPRPMYAQAFVDGESRAAIYLATAAACRLIGVTRQLVGEPWLHAARFAYCGSVGPLCLSAMTRRQYEQLGEVLTAGCGLRGLFGVDVIDGVAGPVPVEVNPRYTASVEVLEHALGVPLLCWHAAAFQGADLGVLPDSPGGVVGKAVLYAATDLTVPTSGPWADDRPDPFRLPRYADVPHPGDAIPTGRPILTVFAQSETVEACLAQLRAIAEATEQRLFGHD